MKKGWQTKRLGDVCEIIKGRKPALKATSSNGDLPYLVAKVMRGSKEAEYASVKDRNSITVEESETIIICDGSNSGEVFTGFRGILSSTMGKIAKKAEIDDDYLRAFLASTFDVFNGAKTGAAIPHLDKEAMYQLQFPFPPLAEQQRIVGLLDEAFEGIATAKANAEKNLQNARALFESHLQSVFTQRGPGWVETTLEEVLTLQPQNGWSPPAANHATSGTPVLTLSSVTGFVFRPNKLKYTSAKTDPKARYWIQNGDLLITRSNTPELVGHVAIASGIEGSTIYPDLIMRMNPMPDRALTKFLYYQLRTPELRTEIMGRAQGANPTMKKISNGAVKTLPISVPPIATQQAIVAKLEALTEETQSLARLYERKLAALEALKKSLLHQAFTGKLQRLLD